MGGPHVLHIREKILKKKDEMKVYMMIYCRQVSEADRKVPSNQSRPSCIDKALLLAAATDPSLHARSLGYGSKEMWCNVRSCLSVCLVASSYYY